MEQDSDGLLPHKAAQVSQLISQGLYAGTALVGASNGGSTICSHQAVIKASVSYKNRQEWILPKAAEASAK